MSISRSWCARTHSERDLADELRNSLSRVAQRYCLHPNVIGYSAADAVAMPESDHAMWQQLVRDATPPYGPEPTALLAHLQGSLRPIVLPGR